MGNCLIGGTNLVRAATLTAGSAEAALPITNIAGDQGDAADGWQTTAGVLTEAAGAWFQATIPGAMPWQAFVLARTNLTPSAQIRFTVTDPVNGVTVDQTVAGPIAGLAQVVCVAKQAGSGVTLRVAFQDPTNPDGFINIPIAWAGAPWQPVRNCSYSSSYGRDRTENVTTTRGGQEYGLTQFVRRRWTVTHASLSSNESFQQLDQVFQAAATQTNILFIPDPNSPTLSSEAVLGRLTPKSDLTYSFTGAERRTVTFDVTERL